MSKVIQVTIPDETYRLLEIRAEQEKIKIATMVTALIRRELERGNNTQTTRRAT